MANPETSEIKRTRGFFAGYSEKITDDGPVSSATIVENGVVNTVQYAGKKNGLKKLFDRMKRYEKRHGTGKKMVVNDVDET